jgi:chromosome segregation ATPase
MRFVLIFSLLLFSLKGAVVDIKKKISSTEQNIGYVKTTISHMNHALDLIVQRIKKESLYLQNINNEINKIKQQIKELQTQLSDKRVSLDNLEAKRSKLLKEQKELEEELINFISNNFYLSNSDSVSMTDVINEEIVNSVTKESSKKIEKISSRYLAIEKEIEKINQLIEEIKRDKNVLEAREKELLQLQEKKKKKIALLNQEKIAYKSSLNKILEYQKSLENKLSTLNV